MLDALLGRKFSAKCKQSIKCVKARIVLIRKKKQAMLSFLKKDVADLLARGHDTNALGRMDGLMVEMNKISCYDMIEHYCDSILGQLSCLEKKRECPQEEMVAVATLIFAAARFSDLPELGDLRHVFINRYGSALESSVDAQFVEKNVTKAFSKDKKLMMMQDISHEFYVPWDFKLFDQKRIYPSVEEVPRRTGLPISDTKQASLHAMVNEQEMDDAIRKQHTSTRSRIASAPKYDVLKEIKHTQVKDIQMVSNLNNGFQADCMNNSESTIFDEPQNIKPPCTNTANVWCTKPGRTLDGHDTEDQQDAVFISKRSQERVTNHGRERKVKESEPTQDRSNIHLHDKTKGYKERTYPSDYNKSNISYGNSNSLDGSSSFVSKARVAGVIKAHGDKEGSYTASQAARVNRDWSRNISPINQEGLDNKTIDYHEDFRTTGMSKSQNKRSDLVESEDDNWDLNLKNHGRELKMNYDISQNMISPDIKLKRQYHGNHPVDYHKDGSALGTSNSQEGLYSSVAKKKHVNDRFKNLVPPYVKSTGSKGGFHTKEQHDAVVGHKARIQHDIGPPCQDQEQHDAVVGHKARIQHDIGPVGSHAVDYHNDSSIMGRPNAQDLYASVAEKPVAAMEHANDRHENVIPQYVKTIGSKARFHGKDLHDGVTGHKVRIQQDTELPPEEREAFRNVKSVGALPLKNVAPPYVKSDAGKNGDQVEHSINAISAVKDNDASYCRRSDDNEHANLMKANMDEVNKPEPRSVRRKHSKLQILYEHKNISVDERGHVGNKIPSEGKDGERRSATNVEDDHDEDEMFMDKLLMHYSRKGMSRQAIKSRSRSKTRITDNMVESDEVRKHHRGHHKGHADFPEAVHNTLEKTISLPSKQMGRADVRKPERASSMEPGTLNPPGGRVHPRLPDCDELMARFNALRT